MTRRTVPAAPMADREPDDLDAMRAEVEADPVALVAYKDAAWRRTFLQRLSEVRGDRPQREVAARMGTTQSAVSDLEQGRVDPRLSTLQRYVRAVGARVDVALVAHGTEPFELTAPRVVPFADQVAEDRGVSSVLYALAHEPQAQSSGSVADFADLPEPTVSYAMGRLEATGWLAKDELAASGEPRFRLRERRGLLIGITVRRDFVQAALTDLRSSAVFSQEYKLPDKSPAGVVRVVARAVRELEGKTGDSGDIVGLGVVLAGRVDGDLGLVVAAPPLQGEQGAWREVPLEEMLEEAVTYHVAVASDANALAMHAHVLAGSRQDAYVVLITEDAISAGHVAGGTITNGNRGLSGQIGHMTVRPKGPSCICGAHGCLDAVAGVPALLAAVSAACGVAVGSIEQASYLVQDENEAAGQAFRDAGAALGNVLACILPALGLPEVLVYGPPEMTAEASTPSAAAYVSALRRAVAGVEVLGNRVSVRARPVDATLVCQAAATSARRHFLANPRRWLPSLARTSTRPEPTVVDLRASERPLLRR